MIERSRIKFSRWTPVLRDHGIGYSYVNPLTGRQVAFRSDRWMRAKAHLAEAAIFTGARLHRRRRQRQAPLAARGHRHAGRGRRVLRGPPRGRRVHAARHLPARARRPRAPPDPAGGDACLTPPIGPSSARTRYPTEDDREYRRNWPGLYGKTRRLATARWNVSPERLSSSQRARDARTRFGRAVYFLRRDAGPDSPNEHVRELAHYDAATLLWLVLGDAESLLDAIADEHLDGYEVEFAEKHARAISDAIRARRRAVKLEQVEGRTPEEAATFIAKARELRGATS